MFSPDGRWLAYSSVESGHPEVYVRPFPGPGGRWLIGAGANPTWSRSKRELFYGVNGRIMVAAFAVNGDSFPAEKPHEWSAGTLPDAWIHPYVRPAPRRRAVCAGARGAATREARQDSLVFIFNFFEELRRIEAAPKP